MKIKNHIATKSKQNELWIINATMVAKISWEWHPTNKKETLNSKI